MFDLTPISTTNLFTTGQILVVIIGFYFSWKSLEATRKSAKVAMENAQAQLVNQIIQQGRDLQHKFAERFYDSSEKGVAAKKQQFIGTIIGYYASCFELGQIFSLPENVKKILKTELQQLMQEKQVREVWEKVKNLHSKEFNEHVKSLGGV